MLLLAIGFGLANLVRSRSEESAPSGALFLGLVIIAVVLGVLTIVGRRRQKTAMEKRRAEVAEQRARLKR